VRVTVWDESHQRKCVKEGSTAHRAFALTVGEAVESAIKGAETDATKRALVLFGWPFGLALYDKNRTNVGHDAPEQRQIAAPSEKPMAPIDEGFSSERTAPKPTISDGRSPRRVGRQPATAARCPTNRGRT
jgi:hypothetical protein